MRRVFIVPGPVLRTFPDTFQLTAVSPAACVGPGETVRKVTTAESKVKSPWNPIEPLGSPGGIVLSMNVVVTGIRTTPDGEGPMNATGSATLIGRLGQVPFGALLGSAG